MAHHAFATADVRPTYWWIQYLRGLAATAVVVFHVYDGALSPPGQTFEIGRHGVDVFFVISGFVMYSAARTESVQAFLTRRLTRIYRLYWIATMFAVGVYFLTQGSHPSGTEAVQSLALWPHYAEAHPDEIWPMLVPGWTLSYELYFYGLFAIGLLFRRVVLIPGVIIVAMVALGFALRPHSAPFVVATSPLLLEFLLGMVVGVMAHRRPAWLPVLAAVSLAGVLTGLALGQYSLSIYAGATLVVAGAVLIEQRFRHGPVPGLRLLGDASYSIYLVHLPALQIIERLFPRTWLGGGLLVGTIVAVAAIISAMVVGVVAHLAVERPLMRTLNRWTRPAAPTPEPS